MFRNELSAIAAFMREHNPFFTDGYAHAWQDPETGYIWADTVEGRKPIFPDDRLGNYFYLRATANGRMAMDNVRFPVMGCKLTGMMAVGTIRLVATVKDADSDLLTARLVNVLALYNAGTVQVSGFNYYRETVLIDEMRYAAADDKDAALQRIGSEAIISIDFTINAETGFKTLTCLPDICATC